MIFLVQETNNWCGRYDTDVLNLSRQDTVIRSSIAVSLSVQSNNLGLFSHYNNIKHV